MSVAVPLYGGGMDNIGLLFAIIGVVATVGYWILLYMGIDSLNDIRDSLRNDPQ